MSLRLAFSAAACLLLARAAGANGILISRSAGGFEFSDALTIAVNTKDKALNLGPQAKVAGPLNKLPDIRLAGTLLKDGASGAVAVYDRNGATQYLLPQGLPKNAPPDVAAAWRSAKISFKKSQADKTLGDVSGEAFVAYLPAGVQGLADVCMDRQALELLAGKTGYFALQIELLAAAVKAYGSNPAMAVVERYVAESMRRNHDNFETGMAGAEALEQGLQFAKLSQHAYADQPEHQRLRSQLAQRRAWLDKKLAVLRALYAGGQWDAFLLGYRDFERYQWSFKDMMEKHAESLKQSLQSHWETGKQRLASGEFRGAFQELRKASHRNPSNSALQKEAFVAWTEYSRQNAVDRRASRKQLSPGQQAAIQQSLVFASRYKDEKKLEEALKSVTEAESIDAESLPVLLKKAEILAARNELAKALAALDEYDLRAVDEERAPGGKLRNELLFQLTNNLVDLKRQLEAAWNDQGFHRTQRLAAAGLRAKEDDPDLLYFAGVSSLVTRNRKQGRDLLARYLEVSNTIEANKERRSAVYRLLATLKEERAEGAGQPNWLSGLKLPAGVFYCPISLAFQPHVERIAASNKLAVQFEWDGDRLKAVLPRFEKPEHATGEKPVYFGYDPQVPQVRTVGSEGPPAGPGADPDEALKKSSVVLLNHPLVDPLMVERLKKQPITVTVAGNRFFHPFVWEKPYFFRVSYDENGRVVKARQAPDRDGAPGGEVLVECAWNGLKLTALRAYQLAGGDESKRVLIYERRQNYEEDRLVSEDIQTRGKTLRIKYLYKGNQLVSAECDKDESLDGREREVAFVAAAASRGK